MNKLSSDLECHKTIVRKLQRDIAKLHEQISSQKKFEVSFPNSDTRRVKGQPLAPTGKLNVQKSDATRGLPASAALLTEPSPSYEDIYNANMTRVEEAEAALIAHNLQRLKQPDIGSDDLFR
jgi:hypothetical protein